MITETPDGTVGGTTLTRKKIRPVTTLGAESVPVPGEFLDAAPVLTDKAPDAAPWDATYTGTSEPGTVAAPTAAPTATATPKAPAADASAPWTKNTPILPDATPAAPTAIPDGSGGAIPVPPPPAPPASPAGDAMVPWEGTDPILIDNSAATPAPETPAAVGQTPPLADTFTAEDNLINRQIGPAPSQRALDLQAQQDALLGRVTNGPDRFALAKQQYDDFTQQSESDYRRARIDETNRAAEGGYLSSGRLSNAYGDADERRQLNDLRARNEFLTPALTGTIQDNLNNLGAARGLATDAYGQGAADRDETRGERDYQRQLAEQAITRRIQQQAAEAGLTQQDFENAMRQYQLGNFNNPTGTYENAAQNASQEASGAGDDVAALLRAYAARRAPEG